MKPEEQIGWIGMCLGLTITALPFITSFIIESNFNPVMLVISFLGFVMFIIGLVKASPEIINKFVSDTKQSSRNRGKISS